MADDIRLAEDEYEEISSDEVDRVIGALEDLMESVASENIRAYIEDAINGIFYLVYEDEEGTDTAAQAA